MPKRKPHKLPHVGSVFEHRYRGETYTMRVVKNRGKIAFEVSGHLFPSPSAPAKDITKTEVNGWTFWGIIPRS